MTESNVSQSLRHAAGLVELHAIQSGRVVSISVDAFGDVDMHLECDEFDRLLRLFEIAETSVTSRLSSCGTRQIQRFVKHGATWSTVRGVADGFVTAGENKEG